MSPHRKHHDLHFSTWAKVQHLLVIVLFALLLLTGLPQKWPYAEASRWLIDQMGGIFLVRWLHRVAGFAFTALTVAHVATAVGALLTRRSQPSMLFTYKDFKDVIQDLRYFLGQEEQPAEVEGFDYKQKFEYWGIIFGSGVMVVTGLVLYLPILASRVLPAELLPAAKVMHSNEALLALLIVLFWHLYNAVLSPEAPPLRTMFFQLPSRRSILEAMNRTVAAVRPGARDKRA